MAQYIDKAAVVAEIERRLEKIANALSEDNRELSAIHGAQIYELINLAKYINTLEVKEMDSTDVFIDKVVNFLEILGYAYTITDNITKSLYDNTQLIEDFKSYMEE